MFFDKRRQTIVLKNFLILNLFIDISNMCELNQGLTSNNELIEMGKKIMLECFSIIYFILLQRILNRKNSWTFQNFQLNLQKLKAIKSS